MIEKAGIVRSGARTFIGTEYTKIGIAVGVIAFLISMFIERTAGITFLVGALISGGVCALGMEAAAFANIRVANRARKTQSLLDTFKVALLGGSIPGLSVQAFVIIGLIVLWTTYGGPKLLNPGSGIIATLGSINASTTRFATLSFGASIVAMFSRVAGGNYTKAADISSDIVGKQRKGYKEDDARIPNVLADFIGDLVNDIAGNCSDLLESTLGAVVATILIGNSMFATALNRGVLVTEQLFNATAIYPVLILAGGLLSCLISLIYVIKFRKNCKSPSHEIDLVTYISAGLTTVASLGITYILFHDINLYPEFTFGWLSPFVATVMGIICGVAIGSITEFYTSTGKIKNKLLRKLFKMKPTEELAEIAHEGASFEVTLGDSIGFRSVIGPAIFMVLAIVFASKIAGDYGLAMAAVGMLSFVGTTVSIDAFGPIADNAGGFAESCHLGDDIRKITDELDGLGNMTAAVGKGFAIGSGGLAAYSLTKSFISAYIPADQPLVLNMASSNTTAGLIFGAALVFYFSGVLLYNAIKAAREMADDGQEKLDKIENGADPKPLYLDCIKKATKNAIKYMIRPSLICVVAPVITGVLFGAEFVGGLLNGANVTAIPLAIFFGNSGGAFDNAKKLLEQGRLFGISEEKNPKLYKFVHDVLVTCDTIGDPRKDSVGPSLDVFIKEMSTVSITSVALFMAITILG